MVDRPETAGSPPAEEQPPPPFSALTAWNVPPLSSLYPAAAAWQAYAGQLKTIRNSKFQIEISSIPCSKLKIVPFNDSKFHIEISSIPNSKLKLVPRASNL